MLDQLAQVRKERDEYATMPVKIIVQESDECVDAFCQQKHLYRTVKFHDTLRQAGGK